MKDVFDRASTTYDLVGPPMFSTLASLAAPLIPRSVGQRVVEVGAGAG